MNKTKTEKEIIEEVLKGETENDNYNALKNMFPELFEQISKEMLKALLIQREEFNKKIEELKKRLKGICGKLSIEDESMIKGYIELFINEILTEEDLK